MVAKKKEPMTLIPTKRTYKINFSKLQVIKEVTSRVRLRNGHNPEIVIIRNSALLLK